MWVLKTKHFFFTIHCLHMGQVPLIFVVFVAADTTWKKELSSRCCLMPLTLGEDFRWVWMHPLSLGNALSCKG